MKSKWKILTTYNCSGTDYIVLVKRKKNGMFKVRTKRITRWFTLSYRFPLALEKLKELEEE